MLSRHSNPVLVQAWRERVDSFVDGAKGSVKFFSRIGACLGTQTQACYVVGERLLLDSY